MTIATRLPGGLAEGVIVLKGNADAVSNFTGDSIYDLGSFFITTAGVDAVTLALPKAGAPAPYWGSLNPGGSMAPDVPGGDDGRVVRFISAGAAAHAHTVTTPANGIANAKHIATFAGLAIGEFIEFIAYNGIWFPLAQSGITLT